MRGHHHETTLDCLTPFRNHCAFSRTGRRSTFFFLCSQLLRLWPNAVGVDVGPDAHDRYWKHYEDVHETCIVIRHGSRDSTQFEGGKGGPNKRPCADLRPHFQFASIVPDGCQRTKAADTGAGAGGAEALLPGDWTWACSAGATVTRESQASTPSARLSLAGACMLG